MQYCVYLWQAPLEFIFVQEHDLTKEKKKKTTVVEPLPTSIKEKETHWPKEP